MIAIKADYRNGKITLIDQMPVQIKKAKLTIVVEPIDDIEQTNIPAQEFIVAEKDHYDEYKLIGLHHFFDTDDDRNINWEEYFGLR